jgi:hypothetical protein
MGISSAADSIHEASPVYSGWKKLELQIFSLKRAGTKLFYIL